MIYFDNAATTWQKPEQVYQTVDDILRHKSGNPSRGSHQIALDASRVIFGVRKKVADFFNIEDSSRLAFTKNATEASNLVFKGFLEEGDHVIISSLEHNATFRPLNRLQEEGVIDLTIIDTEVGQEQFLKDIQRAITSRTKLIALTHASNLTGNILPVEQVGSLAAKEEVAFFIDAAQTAGIEPIDLQKIKADFLVFTGHKALFGPQGVGGLYFNPDIDFSPLLEGGTGGSSKKKLNPDLVPDKYESGTLNTAGIAGLGAGLDFIKEESLDQIKHQEEKLMQQLMIGLEKIPAVEVLTSEISEKRVGVTSFQVTGIDSATIGQLLNTEYNIAVRTGIHCAPLAHQSIGSYDTGAVRVSFSYFNTQLEVDKLLTALQEIIDSVAAS
ncbi:MAG: aminotransferase class V-fold PLP-dependent enzyme [Bacillota bacterium]